VVTGRASWRTTPQVGAGFQKRFAWFGLCEAGGIALGVDCPHYRHAC
jgi:hypothetical protein